jgi:hypothetical protein
MNDSTESSDSENSENETSTFVNKKNTSNAVFKCLRKNANSNVIKRGKGKLLLDMSLNDKIVPNALPIRIEESEISDLRKRENFEIQNSIVFEGTENPNQNNQNIQNNQNNQNSQNYQNNPNNEFWPKEDDNFEKRKPQFNILSQINTFVKFIENTVNMNVNTNPTTSSNMIPSQESIQMNSSDVMDPKDKNDRLDQIFNSLLNTSYEQSKNSTFFNSTSNIQKVSPFIIWTMVLSIVFLVITIAGLVIFRFFLTTFSFPLAPILCMIFALISFVCLFLEIIVFPSFVFVDIILTIIGTLSHWAILLILGILLNWITTLIIMAIIIIILVIPLISVLITRTPFISIRKYFVAAIVATIMFTIIFSYSLAITSTGMLFWGFLVFTILSSLLFFVQIVEIFSGATGIYMDFNIIVATHITTTVIFILMACFLVAFACLKTYGLSFVIPLLWSPYFVVLTIPASVFSIL